jgi:hypothetical protein
MDLNLALDPDTVILFNNDDSMYLKGQWHKIFVEVSKKINQYLYMSADPPIKSRITYYY